MVHQVPAIRKISVIFVLAIVVTNAHAQSDTEPVKLLSLTITPATVDVTSSQQTVNVSMHLTDNLSGIDTTSGRGVGISFTSPSGNQSASGVPAKLPGTILDTTLSIDVVVPKYVEPGTWKAFIRLADNTGNTIFLNFDALVAAGFPASFDVVDATPDNEAPQLAAVSLTPSAVELSLADSLVTVDLTLTDNLAGVGWTDLTFHLILQSPSGNQSQVLTPLQLQLISGTTTNGVWRSTILMPRYSEPGTWKLSLLRLQDLVRNTRIYDAVDLAAFGSSAEELVSSSPSDTTTPTLLGLTFNPAVVNSALGSQTVQVEMTISDDLSGVSFRSDTPNVSARYGVTVVSPSGAQLRNTNSTNFAGETAPISGTAINGTWRFNLVIPQFSEEGTWSASSLIKDRVRNIVQYSSTALSALGLPNQLVVIRPSLEVDGSISDPATGGTVSDAAFGSRASLIVPPGVLTQPTTIAIDVLQSPLNLPLPNGFSTAETYFMNVTLTPPAPQPLPPPGITVVLPLRNYQIPGTALNLFFVDPSTGTLVPYLDGSGQPLSGQVDAGGLSVTFSGVTHFSTIVGLLPETIRVNIDIKPGETPNVLNPGSKGTTPVAVMSTPTFDVTKVDWQLVTFCGARVAQNKKGNLQFSIMDVNGDGLDDVVAQFQTSEILLSRGDRQAVVEGQTLDGRRFRGTDSIKVLK